MYDKNVYWSSCKVPVILVKFSLNTVFLDRFSKNTQISDIIKSRPVGAQLFFFEGQTEGQADRHDEFNSRFWKLRECAEKLLATLT